MVLLNSCSENGYIPSEHIAANCLTRDLWMESYLSSESPKIFFDSASRPESMISCFTISVLISSCVIYISYFNTHSASSELSGNSGELARRGIENIENRSFSRHRHHDHRDLPRAFRFGCRLHCTCLPSNALRFSRYILLAKSSALVSFGVCSGALTCCFFPGFRSLCNSATSSGVNSRFVNRSTHPL